MVMVFGQRRRTTAAKRQSRDAVDGKLSQQLFAYEMLAARRNQQDSMLWQAPALALTAQAFLLTIALGGNTVSIFARALAAGLGLVVACMSMQLMAKHRHLTELDNAWLAAMEKEIGLPPVAARGVDASVGPRRSVARRIRSYVVWQLGLGLFALANLAILLVIILRPSLL
jgi:hypothetical protein